MTAYVTASAAAAVTLHVIECASVEKWERRGGVVASPHYIFFFFKSLSASKLALFAMKRWSRSEAALNTDVNSSSASTIAMMPSVRDTNLSPPIVCAIPSKIAPKLVACMYPMITRGATNSSTDTRRSRFIATCTISLKISRRNTFSLIVPRKPTSATKNMTTPSEMPIHPSTDVSAAWSIGSDELSKVKLRKRSIVGSMRLTTLITV
eukprot:CAMPEP_0113880482 /NCGR_PEP_ID=MMETSP0780_2-20120614/7812_1 /TAXON_ID=652834 /ORGANISM="Palpitomonas bilix" /LENGTH=207 /DNA_ID=CAMNT_0000867167 /DNA_START=267 /DNA_END=890 /DNA_ORIENTATION=- /assembly_acc=CAM_ASM_000599